MHFMSKIPNPSAELERHAYISNVYVTPGSRGGVGTRLLNAAIGAAKASYVDSVVLWPTEQSRSLYLRQGFAADGAALTLKFG
jgi:predicted GNAT family N-acyltransferase